MDEIQRTIISRAKLEEYGYLSGTISDNELGCIAEELLECLGFSEHFSEALECVMKERVVIKPYWIIRDEVANELALLLLTPVLTEYTDTDSTHTFQEKHIGVNMTFEEIESYKKK